LDYSTRISKDLFILHSLSHQHISTYIHNFFFFFFIQPNNSKQQHSVIKEWKKNNIEELYNLPPETGNLYIFRLHTPTRKKNYFIAYFSSFFSSEIKNIPDDERLMCNNLYNFFKPFAYCFGLWKCQGSGRKLFLMKFMTWCDKKSWLTFLRVVNFFLLEMWHFMSEELDVWKNLMLEKLFIQQLRCGKEDRFFISGCRSPKVIF